MTHKTKEQLLKQVASLEKQLDAARFELNDACGRMVRAEEEVKKLKGLSPEVVHIEGNVVFDDLLHGQYERAGSYLRRKDASPQRTSPVLDAKDVLDLAKPIRTQLGQIRSIPCETPECKTTVGDIYDAPSGDEEPGPHSPLVYCGACWDRVLGDLQAGATVARLNAESEKALLVGLIDRILKALGKPHAGMVIAPPPELLAEAEAAVAGIGDALSETMNDVVELRELRVQFADYAGMGIERGSLPGVVMATLRQHKEQRDEARAETERLVARLENELMPVIEKAKANHEQAKADRDRAQAEVQALAERRPELAAALGEEHDMSWEYGLERVRALVKASKGKSR